MTCTEGTQVKRKNVIVKGFPSSSSLKELFRALCVDTLNISEQDLNVRSMRNIFDRNNKMGLIAELNSVLKRASRLAKTKISVEKDLNSEKQIQKKVMLQLKKDVLQADISQRVTVRDERMKIADKWFYWNLRKEFTCGRDRLRAINFNYYDILSYLNNRI
ncbi:hypothetical protein ACFFRR_009593 [Megaselia abdita]